MKNHRSKHSWKELYLKISFLGFCLELKIKRWFFKSPPFLRGVFLRQRTSAFYLFCCQYTDSKAILWYFLHRIFKAFVLSITIPTIYGFIPKPCVRKSFFNL